MQSAFGIFSTVNEDEFTQAQQGATGTKQLLLGEACIELWVNGRGGLEKMRSPTEFFQLRSISLQTASDLLRRPGSAHKLTDFESSTRESKLRSHVDHKMDKSSNRFFSVSGTSKRHFSRRCCSCIVQGTLNFAERSPPAAGIGCLDEVVDEEIKPGVGEGCEKND
jgi:hypothetical protein